MRASRRGPHALVREDPENAFYRGSLAENYLNRGLARSAMGDPAGTAADVRRAVGLYDALPSRTQEQWFLSACAHAALAGLAGRAGSGVSAPRRHEADAAMALLAQGRRDGLLRPATPHRGRPRPARDERSSACG